MPDVAEFLTINICRTDGQDNGPGYWPTPADAAKAASKTATEKTPRTKPQMVRLPEDDPRVTEWRVKLGILLKQELSPTEGLPWLVNFPRGYWLYEKSKHLWVSGYPVKAKLYKTPQEFALHLLWLLSSSSDRADCRCIHCNVRATQTAEDLNVTEVPRPIPGSTNAQPPSKIRKITPQIPISRTASPAPAAATPPTIGKKETPVPVPMPAVKKETPVPVPSIPPQAVPAPAQQQIVHPSPRPTAVQQSQPSLAQVQTASQPRVHTPVQIPQQQQAHHAQQAQPVQQPHQIQQVQQPKQAQQVHQIQQVQQPQQVQQVPQSQQASTPSAAQQPQFLPYPQPVAGVMPSPLFRVGELIWFQVPSGWRLGIVSASGILNPKNSKPEMLQILPISHAYFAQSQVQQLESSARPFLAFSVPGVGIPELQNKRYDDIPWETYLRSLPAEDPHQREVVLLDSSKMAAQKIGQSFSLFTRVSETKDGKKVDYHGIFLGAERMELADALRIRISPEQGLPEAATAVPNALLGLREICTAVDMPGAVFFKGDIYQPITGDTQPACGIPIPEDKLPRPLREESAFRNRYAANDRWRCVLLKQNAVIREQDLKGRFYPTHKLLPLLDGSKVSVEVQNGLIRDVQQRLNQRIDTIKSGSYIGQKGTRVLTIGPALPPGSVIQFGPEVREDTV
ncbi:hypothetical protein CSOJ01_04204 [Colletotrichum sojae]|uniref:Transcription-silencing protein Clr2 n=1 Tax=Colletotrichum sojae TaxID=2175907 RepID=A0A8H6JJI6_9PEZI|nr:hypothetical protein CSOJ01_04204 [Colletotrichum sojae]